MDDKAVKDMVTRMLKAEHGCGDGSCLFKRPEGMHTNSSCRCIDNAKDYDVRKALKFVLRHGI